MKYSLLPKELQPSMRSSLVKFTNGLQKIEECGNTTFITSTHYGKQTIAILPEREYVVLSTGEVLKMKEEAETRGDNMRTLKNSLARLSKLIDYNFPLYKSAFCFTLTYSENMTDTKRLYKDWVKFWKRLAYRFGSDICSEYIVAFEPQGRGAWHAHACVFQRKKRFVSSDILKDVWGFGFVKIGKRPKSLDSLGKYLTAYLSDIPFEQINDVVKSLTEQQKSEYISRFSKSGVPLEEKNGHKFLKGLRLLLYPARFRFFRWSKGIKQPNERKVYLTAKTLTEKYGSCVSAKEFVIPLEGKEEPLVCKRFIFKKKVNPDFMPLNVFEPTAEQTQNPTPTPTKSGFSPLGGAGDPFDSY